MSDLEYIWSVSCNYFSVHWVHVYQAYILQAYSTHSDTLRLLLQIKILYYNSK